MTESEVIEAEGSTLGGESTITLDPAVANGEAIKPAEIQAPLTEAGPVISAIERDQTPASQVWLVWASLTSLIVAGILVIILEILQLALATASVLHRILRGSENRC